MARVPTVYYQADLDTQFQWATSENDPFLFEQDMSFLARALERHTHGAGRGLPVESIAASVIDATMLEPNSVTNAKIADNAVNTRTLADGSVTTAKVLNGTLKAEDFEAGAVVAHLGYTPVNRAGDTMSAPGTSNLVMGTPTVPMHLLLQPPSAIHGPGYIALDRTAGTVATFGTTETAGIAFVMQNRGATPGHSIGVLNQAGSGYNMLFRHDYAEFMTPVFATRFFASTPTASGLPPLTANSTVMCTNLNANFLNGQLGGYYGRETHEVKAGTHALFTTAAAIPAGWTRNTNLNGRILVGDGASAIAGISFAANTHQGVSWVNDPGHTHPMPPHSHLFSSNVPNATGAPGPAGQYVALGTDTLYNAAGSTNANVAASLWNFPSFAMVLAFKA
jgi:hypothetical protein